MRHSHHALLTVCAIAAAGWASACGAPDAQADAAIDLDAAEVQAALDANGAEAVPYGDAHTSMGRSVATAAGHLGLAIGPDP